MTLSVNPVHKLWIDCPLSPSPSGRQTISSFLDCEESTLPRIGRLTLRRPLLYMMPIAHPGILRQKDWIPHSLVRSGVEIDLYSKSRLSLCLFRLDLPHKGSLLPRS